MAGSCWLFAFSGDFPTYARMTDARHPTDKTDVQFQVILAFFCPNAERL